tara:strand:- start:32139 stop:33836 length:1698 start_codon:yes stop_codon:yes gene_type:complete
MENKMVQEIQLSKIKLDPNNPRKTIDEKRLKELSTSIEEFGVLQPITVRPTDKGHIIVMGERRYRACKLAKLKTIPCIVKDFDSNVISEVQIIENLQRQEVEPMEEAEAIAFLVTKHSPDIISKRIGRTVKYIHSRIKLANLIDDFRPFLETKELTISLAIRIAMFQKDEQKMFYESMGESFRTHIIEQAINTNSYDLLKAPFSLSDEKLITGSGSCNLCPFNSINQGSLFGDDKMLCTKSSCYTSKKTKSLHLLINQVKTNGILIVADFRKYNSDWEENAIIVSLLNENGLIPYIKDDIDYIEEPEKPTMEHIRESNRWMELTEEELLAELAEALEDYEEEMKELEDAPNQGYKKGYLLDPRTYTFKETLLRLKEKAPEENIEVDIDKKKMDQCTPNEKIQKLNDREIRKKHIESNKHFEELVTVIQETDYVNNTKALSDDEMIAFFISSYHNNVNWNVKDKHFKKLLGKTTTKDTGKIIQNFKKSFSKKLFNKMVRVLILQNVHFGESNHLNNEVNNSFHQAIQSYYKDEMIILETKYKEASKAREERLKERISKLEKELSNK